MNDRDSEHLAPGAVVASGREWRWTQEARPVANTVNGWFFWERAHARPGPQLWEPPSLTASMAPVIDVWPRILTAAEMAAVIAAYEEVPE